VAGQARRRRHRGQVIAEIETDKATMEVEAVDEGTVGELLVEAGTEGVKVNAVIARLTGEGGDVAPPPARPAADAAGPPPAPPAKREGSVPADGGETGESVAAPTPPDEGARIAASPLARRLAKLQGIDLRGLTGSGPHGRIIKRDIDAAASAPPSRSAGGAGGGPAAPAAGDAEGVGARVEPAPARTLEQLGVPAGSYDLIPLDNIRRTVARRLTEAARDIPHFPLTIDLEIDRLLEARTRINALLEKDGVKVSVNDIVIKAAAVALKRVPEANASYTPEGIAFHHHADIAMAVAIDIDGRPGGLITPIVWKADTKGLAAIARETKDLATRARDRKLKPQEYQGGTFSISNLGMMGIRQFSSILNPPHGAILSVGAGEQRPVVRGGQLAVATVMTVTLTCDHRVVDGAIGSKFLQVFKGLIEEPLAMLA
jgi:pyruvate dehydrogenase E2 component (dihydrolipoamide acetyltransferase)